MGRKPLGERPLTNAEKKVRQRQAQAAELSALRAEIRRLVAPIYRVCTPGSRPPPGSPAIGYVLRKNAVCTAMEPERMALIHRAFLASGESEEHKETAVHAADDNA